MTPIIAYLIAATWGVALLVAVEHTNNTWSDLWRVLCRPLPWSTIPRAVARPRAAP